MKLFNQVKKIPLMVWNIGAFLFGCIFGLILWKLELSFGCDWVPKVVDIISPFGNIMVSMLKMVVIPVIFLSLVNGAVSLKLKAFGRIGIFVFLWYLVTSVIAAIWGTAAAFLCNPTLKNVKELANDLLGQADTMRVTADGGTSPLLNIFYSLFKNPIEAMSKGEFLPIIVFALLFGLAARVVIDTTTDEHCKKQLSTMLECLEAMQKIVFLLISWVLCYFPIGIFALTLSIFATVGIPLLTSYLQVAGCVIFGILTMLLLCYPGLIFIFCHEKPYKIMWRIREPILTAFVTRSSAAALPVSLKTARHEFHIKDEISGFTLALGATVNMDGVCIHLPVFAVLAANLFGQSLTLSQIFIIIISVVFASVGAGGVPGGSIFLLFMVLDCLSLSPDQSTLIVALALGINPLLDMFETACNVAGDNVGTYVVSKRMGLFEKNASTQSEQ